MTGIVLAAGIGSRLRPFTDSTPKCLLPVGTQPLLPRTLRALQEAGIGECILVTGHLHSMIETAVASLHLSMPVRCMLNARYASTNNNASLWLAGSAAGNTDILVLDADILFDPRLLPLLLHAPAPDALLIREDHHLGSEEIKVVVDRGFVAGIGKTENPAHAAGESIGIEKFSAATAQKLFATLGRRKERNEFYEASFQELIDAGAHIAAVPTGGLPCMEIDTPDDLTAASQLAVSLGI